MSTAPHSSVRRRPSWLGVIGASVAIFLVVLALLWVRVSAGEDPVLGAQASAAQVTTTDTSATDTSSSSDSTSTDSTSPSDTSSSASSDVPTTAAS